MASKKSISLKRYTVPLSAFLLILIIIAELYLTSLHNYLLFHSLVEIFAVFVTCAVFIIAWNSRRFLDNNYLLFMGVASLFIGVLDLLHTLAYKGMGVFQGYDANLATQLWIAARYTQAFSFLVAPLLLGKKLRPNFVFSGYALVTSLLLMAIFYWNTFPACFVEGVGLTPFKKVSEYIISAILVASTFLLFQKRKAFDKSVFQLSATSLILTIGAELAFTTYVSVYGFSNMLGHLFRVAASYLIYKALVETGLNRPYDLMFRNLSQTQRAWRASEEDFLNLVEDLPVGVTVATSDGKVIQRNRASVEMFGYESEEESLKMPIVETYLNPADRERFLELMGKGQAKNIQLARKRKDGSVFWTSTTAIPMHQGLENKHITVTEDITERKKTDEELAKHREHLEELVKQRTFKLENLNENLKREIEERKLAEEENKLKAYLLDAANDAVFLRDYDDPEAKLIYVNEAAIRTFGYTRSEFYAMSMTDLARWTSPEQVLIRKKLLEATGKHYSEIDFRHKDGSRIPVANQANLVTNRLIIKWSH